MSVGAEHLATALDVTVSIPGKSPISRSFTWEPEWSGGPPRRIVVPVTGSGLTTGAFSYTLQVQAMVGGTPAASGSDTGTVVIVDNSASPFGTSWWLDGLERLRDIDQPQTLWIGGDGSTRRYARQGTSNLWLVTPEVDRVDSLVRVD